MSALRQRDLDRSTGILTYAQITPIFGSGPKGRPSRPEGGRGGSLGLNYLDWISNYPN